jgi:hypothetical protein
MGASDWIAVVLLGLGAIMGTFGRRMIRMAGVALIVVGVIGWFVWREHQVDAQQTITGTDNNVITVPGSNNNITVAPSDPAPKSPDPKS